MFAVTCGPRKSQEALARKNKEDAHEEALRARTRRLTRAMNGEVASSSGSSSPGSSSSSMTTSPVGRGRVLGVDGGEDSSDEFGPETTEWPTFEGMSLVNRAIFQAPPPSYGERSHPWSPAHCVMLDSGAGYAFPCVWVPCRRTRAERVIIHCHANACDIGHIFALCARDAECWRADVLLVEYPGYGTSKGVPYEKSVDRHVAAAYVHVTEEIGVNPRDVWVLGRSLGTGPATKLASAVERLDGNQLGGVILHSPFTSIKEAGLALLGNVASIMTDRWDNRVWMTRYSTHTLIVHALEDEVVPYSHAKTLDDIRRSAGLPCTMHTTHGTHNYFSYYRDYLQPILSFIDEGAKPGVLPRKIAPLPDPIPRAPFSKAQVQNIMSLVKEQQPDEVNSEDSLGMRFYGMVDSVGETIQTGANTSSKRNGFSRFGSGDDVTDVSTPSRSRSDSPRSAADTSNSADDNMILTPGGARPKFV